ncbi:phosphatase PAP2 family protein [Streptomyces sp. NPDC048665]|uniref:phosphatase PAP2 family protein n=1 Tax=Streptomyces sp. NPDC048665 TaxID=3155490 RepID=UPI00342FCA7B
MIGWKADHLQGVAWSLVGVLFAAVIPMLFIDHGIKRGRWGDRNVGARKARLLVMAVILLSVLTCFAFMTTLDAPRVLSALIASMLITLAALALVTLAWKISVHQAVSAGAVIMLAQTYGPWALLGYVLVAIVGWSRIELRDHTPAQVIVGTLLGTAIAAATFAALR